MIEGQRHKMNETVIKKGRRESRSLAQTLVWWLFFIAIVIMPGCDESSDGTGNLDTGPAQDDMSLGADAQMVADAAFVDMRDASVRPASDVQLVTTDVEVPVPILDGTVSPSADAATSTQDAEVGRDAQFEGDATAEVPAWMPRETPTTPIIVDAGSELLLLIIGNNYVGMNQLCEKLEVLALGTTRWSEVNCVLKSEGGYQLNDHARDAATGQDQGSDGLYALLDPQNLVRPEFDLMILQERSDMTGFPSGNEYREAFEDAAEELVGIARRIDLPTALLMPWAYPYGQPANAGLYPDFRRMQARIAESHYQLAAQLSYTEPAVEVIEVGEVWYRTEARDPLGDFLSLYQAVPSDPNFDLPSDVGTWLMAAAILYRVVGVQPGELPVVPDLPPTELWLRLLGDLVSR